MIVVAGVLLALQVSNWSEARSNKKGAMNTLVRLKNEVSFNIINLDDRIASIETSRAERDRAMLALALCDDSPEAISAVTKTINEMSGDILPSFVDNSLRELARNDQYLELLTDAFRAELNIYDAQLADERSQLEINFQLMWDDHVLRNPSVYVVIPEGDMTRGSVALHRPMAELCNDPVFSRQLIMTEGWHQAATSRMARFKEQSQAFLLDIDAEFERLN
ncbi:MAG: hypothetical protein AAGB02_06935 [Pseudomonadota bacterium]